MIFCIEDDHSIRDLMIYTLNSAGFQAEGFTDGASLFAALQTVSPQLILLDLMLPGEDGISILKKLNAVPRQSCSAAYSAKRRGIHPAHGKN